MVQSLCRDAEKARQWLCRYRAQLGVELARVLEKDGERARLKTARS